MLGYRIRREFETKAFGTLRIGQVLDAEEFAALFVDSPNPKRNADALLAAGFVEISDVETPANSTEKHTKRGRK